MRRVFMAFCLSVCASPAVAQSVYIGAAAGVETTLTSHVDVAGHPQTERGGTTPVLAVRAGLGLGERWGAEVEVAYALTREQTIEGDFDTPGVYDVFPVRLGDPGPTLVAPIRLTPLLTIESEEQRTTLNALGWYSYPVSARFELVLAGGLAFNRAKIDERRSFNFLVPANLPPLSFSLSPTLQATGIVSYDVGPLVGIEGRIAFGDRLRFVPGVRLSGVSSGWSIRSTAGIAWTF